jgi:hypothetical protein
VERALTCSAGGCKGASNKGPIAQGQTGSTAIGLLICVYSRAAADFRRIRQSDICDEITIGTFENCKYNLLFFRPFSLFCVEKGLISSEYPEYYYGF